MKKELKRLVARKDARELTEAENVLVDYPLTAEEELQLVPYVEYLLEEGEAIPESSEELLEGFSIWQK
jgi:hypothetical protein